MSGQQDTETTFDHVVLLGASNLSLAWPRIMDVLAEKFATPLHVTTAHGMGRSYVCDTSGFAFRRPPGILVSDLWTNLTNAETPQNTFALITDLGNDLLYGRSVEEIIEGAAECIRRLRSWNPDCQIVITRPPVESVENLGRFRFWISKLVLFPFSNLRLPDVQTATLELDRRVCELARLTHANVVQPSGDWYGLDPIHVKRFWQLEAFRMILGGWAYEDRQLDIPVPRNRPSPAKRWVLGREKAKTQPCLSVNEVTVSAY